MTLGENGTLAGARPGAVLVDMTTSEPALAVEIDQAARAKGVHSVDAPVSGGDVGAREARLSIMVGGEKPVVRCALAAIREDGQDDRLPGPRRCRSAHQDGQPDSDRHQHDRCLRGIALRVQGWARPERGAPERLHRAPPGSWSLSNLAPRAIAGNFEPGFFVEHFLKDMGIALAEARRMKLCLPGLALAEQLYRAVEAQGYARKGTHALLLALARLSAIDWTARPN